MTSTALLSSRSNPADVAQDLLGPIRWIGSDRGYCACPGKQFHTHADGKRDCRVILSGAPTVYCVHTSCLAEIKRVNLTLRRELARAAARSNPSFKPWRPFPEDRLRQRQRELDEELKRRAHESLKAVLQKFASSPDEFLAASPTELCDPEDDWRLHLQLFDANDVVWIGDVYDSGPGHERNFRTVAEWLKEPHAPAQHTCPSTFKNNINRKTHENVLAQKFLVVESDTLAKEEICAVFRWMQQFMRLRAIVDTAGRSLHGWFDMPSAAFERQLKEILPAMGCDKALFTPSHSCRLPGAMRDGQFQKLIYMDLVNKPK